MSQVGTKHLLLATVEDAFDVRSWSGIPCSLRTALEKQVDRLTVFRPSRPSRNPLDVARHFILGGDPPRWPLWMTEATLRNNARELSAAIQQSGADAVLSISSQCIARLQTSVPTWMFSDSPWLAWKQCYAAYEPMLMRGPAYAQIESAAAKRCSGLFFGSQWAVDEADRLYYDGNASAEQRSHLHEVHLGANWFPDVSPQDLHQIIRSRPKDRIDLLFVGRDWERKGGPLAVEVVQLLRAAGTNATLHIVGCRPPLPANLCEGDSPAVRIHGLLYRNVPKERAASIAISPLAPADCTHAGRVLRHHLCGGASLRSSPSLPQRPRASLGYCRWRHWIALSGTGWTRTLRHRHPRPTLRLASLPCHGRCRRASHPRRPELGPRS